MRLLILLLGLLLAVPAWADDYVVDTGPGSASAALPVGPQLGTYGQFTLAETSRLDGIEFFGTVTTPGTALFNISFGGQEEPDIFLRTETESFGSSAGPGWYGVSGMDLELGPGTYWVGFTSAGDGFTAQHYGAAPAPLGNEAYYTPTGGYADADSSNLAWRLSVAPAVPEPATWAMMIVGFGAVGTALRRQGSRRAALAV